MAESESRQTTVLKWVKSRAVWYLLAATLCFGLFLLWTGVYTLCRYMFEDLPWPSIFLGMALTLGGLRIVYFAASKIGDGLKALSSQHPQ